MEYAITLGTASGGSRNYGGGFSGFANYMISEPIGIFALAGALVIIILIVSLR